MRLRREAPQPHQRKAGEESSQSHQKKAGEESSQSHQRKAGEESSQSHQKKAGEDVLDRNVRSAFEIWPTLSGVCRRIQDSEPIEIGEALGAQWFHIAPVLLTARANRKCRHFRSRKPLPSMGRNE